MNQNTNMRENVTIAKIIVDNNGECCGLSIDDLCDLCPIQNICVTDHFNDDDFDNKRTVSLLQKYLREYKLERILGRI